MELTWRPLTTADIPALTELRVAAEAADRTGMHASEEDIAEELADVDNDLVNGSLAAVHGDKLVGYGVVRVRGNATDVHRAILDGAVHPSARRQGLGRQLLDRLIACARTVHVARYGDMPLVGSVFAQDHMAGCVAMITGMGFTADRYYYDMRVPLREPVPRPEAPDGLELVPYTRERDEETRLVRNASFATHWATTPASPEVWAHRFTGMKSFVSDASFLMVDRATGAVVGFLLSQFSEADAAATGHRELWIADVGTLSAYRGRGVASALLGRTLAAARDAGFDRAGLSVDTQNSTRALGVYERAGFSVASKWVDYGLLISTGSS